MTQTALPDNLDLTKSSLERLIETANYHRLRFLVMEKDDEIRGYKANAEVKSIDRLPDDDQYTDMVTFNIDRMANPAPAFAKEPNRQFRLRRIYIRRVDGCDILATYGVCGVLYLSLEPDEIPAKTTDLAEMLAASYNLPIQEEDILEQTIPKDAQVIRVQFDPLSKMFTGTLVVDLTTKVTFQE